MVNVGIVGVGFMGMTHFRAYAHVKGARVTAICTRDPKKLAGDWRAIKGNFGEPGGLVDVSSLARHEDWRKTIADPKVDLVDICLPPALHAEVAIAALRAGKHVVVEKPIALATGDADRMTKAANQSGKLLMVAQVLPFFPEYDFVLRAARKGTYGKLLGGYFKRVISDPLWIKDFYDPQGAGGPLVDLHIHDAHFVRLLWGRPRAVFAQGSFRGDVVEFVNSQFLFDDPNVSVSATSGVIAQQGRPFTHAFEIRFARATLVYDLAGLPGTEPAGTPLSLLTADGKVTRPKLTAPDAFVAELSEVVKAARTGVPSSLLSADLARDALEICMAETRSARTGKTVKI